MVCWAASSGLKPKKAHISEKDNLFYTKTTSGSSSDLYLHFALQHSFFCSASFFSSLDMFINCHRHCYCDATSTRTSGFRNTRCDVNAPSRPLWVMAHYLIEYHWQNHWNTRLRLNGELSRDCALLTINHINWTVI